MYKRTSLMTGGGKSVHQKHYPKRAKEHGEIVIRMMGGQVLDPPLRLPGDWSSTAECDNCHELFGLIPSTPAVVLPQEYKYGPFEPRRKYRLFCCEDHLDRWAEKKRIVFEEK